jgi:hypothetical protein
MRAARAALQAALLGATHCAPAGCRLSLIAADLLAHTHDAGSKGLCGRAAAGV